MAFQRPGMSDFTGTVRRQPGHCVQPDTATRPTRSAPADAAAQPGAIALPAAPAVAYPIVPTGDHEQRQHVRLEPADAIHAVVHGRLAAQAGARHRVRAALRRQPSSSGLGHDQHQRDQHHRERLRQRVPARRRRTCRRTWPRAAAPRSRTPARPAPRRCRPSSRTSTGLPGAQAGDAARYTGADWTNATFLGYLAAMNPNPFGFMCNSAPAARRRT